MMRIPIRFLFIPVSSVKGIGEYMRSLILAKEVKLHWPEAEIKFILNRHAKYVDACPFATEVLDSSPTNHIAEVNSIIEDFQPQVVVFDASGRQAQLAKAKSIGAITVFISQHAKKRRRGMKWGRAKYTDFHFVAQPEFAISPLNFFEKLKFKLMGKPVPKCVGIFFNQHTAMQSEAIFQQFDVENEKYIILSAGSGGHKRNDELVADVYYRAAQQITIKTGLKTLMVMGPSYPHDLPVSENVTVISSLENANFIALLAHAKAAVLSGGGALLQALAVQTPVLACAVSKDQPARIKACEQRRIVNSVTLDKLVESAPLMLNDVNLETLKNELSLQPSSSGVSTIIESLALKL